ncbi:AAA family ATPase [Cryptosporangium phraense]|uniref:AAA family ATPase n=1 Tax=Cryptosporangium phraense TaxID=2593070 RepID=A0A545AVD5_9ACTN|nr:AAA family ATPase [Cryptosporangium phraense]TQS45283.1 AAA family ATPase [Cryptosporangium phraense]
MIGTLAVQNYRSLRHLVVGLGRLTVVTGANGTGKSSLYRALRLLADSARNGAVAALAREGGLASTLWAGPETGARESRPQGTVRLNPVSLRLGFAGGLAAGPAAGDEFGYAIDFGLPTPSKSAFGLDPLIKREAIWSGPFLRPAGLLADRANGALRLRDGRGWLAVPGVLASYDSMLSEYSDPQRAPEILQVRERIRSWRFYDHLRTDSDAPVRQAQVGTRTPVLGPDGADLAAALQTIREIGDEDALDAAVDSAFPGSTLAIESEAGRFVLGLRQPGLLRAFGASELSDGTVKYLMWVAALLTPRPPALLVLNEPEASLHPDLLRPLTDLIVAGSARAQVVVISHSRALVSALEASEAEVTRIELIKEFGETRVDGQGRLDEPPWHWPDR